MEIKKLEEGLEIKLNDLKIAVDTLKTKTADIKILTDIKKNINQDKIFNLPGEYEVGGIFIRGYRNNERLIFIFGTRETKIILVDGEIKEDILKQIKQEFGDSLDIGIFKNIKNWQKLKNDLKLKIVIITDKAENFKGEKAKEIKINMKKIEEKDYLLV